MVNRADSASVWWMNYQSPRLFAISSTQKKVHLLTRSDAFRCCYRLRLIASNEACCWVSFDNTCLLPTRRAKTCILVNEFVLSTTETHDKKSRSSLVFMRRQHFRFGGTNTTFLLFGFLCHSKTHLHLSVWSDRCYVAHEMFG